MGRATSNYGGDISRAVTGDAPLPTIGVPVQPVVAQPAMLMTVVFTVPTFGPVSGALNPSGFRNSCTKPMICTGLAGAVALLLNTGTVTSESLTIASL